MPSCPRVLFLFSNPADSDRIRLDREHKALDKVLKDLGLPPETISRAHAVSVEDFPLLLSGAEYEIIHFSGHGSRGGIFLDRDHVDTGVTVGPQQLAAILSTAKRPRAIVLMSCFSTEALPYLAPTAPFLVTVTESAGDQASIEFTTVFYQHYLKSSSVEQAFDHACHRLDYNRLGIDISPCLTRSALQPGDSRFFVVDATGRDSLLIDISPVDSQITQLNVDRDKFLSMLGRKINVHRFVFAFPRERALLSVGSYFAEFSWNHRDDPIVCRRILDLKPEADEVVCRIWARLLLDYNELYAQRYRAAADPRSPEHERVLKIVLGGYRDTLGFLGQDRTAGPLRQHLPKQYKTATAMISANLERAQLAGDSGDQGSVVAYLEGALTAIHDLVDALTEINSVPVEEGTPT